MTPAQFAAALAGTRIRSATLIEAARMVLVDGPDRCGPMEAARRTGTSQGNVSRAVARLQPRHRCPACQGTGYVHDGQDAQQEHG